MSVLASEGLESGVRSSSREGAFARFVRLEGSSVWNSLVSVGRGVSGTSISENKWTPAEKPGGVFWSATRGGGYAVELAAWSVATSGSFAIGSEEWLEHVDVSCCVGVEKASRGFHVENSI